LRQWRLRGCCTGADAGTLFGRSARVVRDFVVTAGVYLGLGLPIALLWILFGNPIPNLSLATWLTLLPLALAGLLVQTLAEELVFRGYFLQQLAARLRSPFWWMVVPSLLFGSLHYDPSAGVMNAGLIVGVTSVFGLIAADLTARTGSLGAAWGFHFANNFTALCILSMDGALTGLSLFRTDVVLRGDGFPALVFLADTIVILAGWRLARRILTR